MMYPKTNHKTDRLRRIVTVVMVFLNTGFALTVGRETEMIFVNTIYVLLDALLHGKEIILLKHFRIWTMCAVFMALTFIIHLDIGAIFEYVRILIIMFCAYYITLIFSFDELVAGFCKCMRFVAVGSCVFYFAFRLFPTLPFPTAANALGAEYYTCLIGNIRISAVEMGVVRNSGLFWEGGMYAALATLWLVCEIVYVKHERHFWMIVVLGVIAILTTNSTTGYLYIVLLMFLMISHSSTGRRTIVQSLLLFGGLCIAIIAVTQFDRILNTLVRYNRSAFEKLLTRNVSFTDRINGPISDLWASLTNPMGVGLLNLQNHVSRVSLDLFGTRLATRTSSLTYFFAAFGPICGVFVNCQWCRAFINTICSRLEALIVIVMFLVLATSTPLQYTFVFWIIIFLGGLGNRIGTDSCAGNNVAD